ncbi:MAG: carboxypeptidase-like regulatory domain-containing protein [Bryobacteraceae bacterium]
MVAKTSILVALLWFSSSLCGQSGSGTIAGNVRDATESPIQGAAVDVINQDTGVVIKTTTNEAGLYRVGALVPGTYRIEASAPGFERLTLAGAVLQVSQTLALDLVLKVGQQSETVTISEQVPLLESQSSNVNQTVNRQMLAGLPLPNRSASSLVLLAPGVVLVDTGAGTAENYPVFSVAGGRVRNQNFCWMART